VFHLFAFFVQSFAIQFATFRPRRVQGILPKTACAIGEGGDNLVSLKVINHIANLSAGFRIEELNRVGHFSLPLKSVVTSGSA
jgi:hypothetical protein